MTKKLFTCFLTFSASLFSIECYESMPDCKQEFFSDGCRIVGDVEFLYWTAETPAAQYIVRPKTPMITEYPQGRYAAADYSFDPGFRVGLRYRNGPRHWEISGLYTWLKTCGKDSEGGNGKVIVPTYNSNLVFLTSTADSDISLSYQVLDILAARVFDPNPHLRIRVYGGITAAWINQDWDILYADPFGDSSQLSQDWCYKGVGFRAGSLFDWFWIWDIYLTGRVSAAITTGRYKNTSQQSLTIDEIQEPSFWNAEYVDHRVATHLQMLLGFSYQKLCKCVDYELFAGYEMNAWNNINEFFSSALNAESVFYPTVINNGLLGLHGLTVRFTLSY